MFGFAMELCGFDLFFTDPLSFVLLVQFCMADEQSG